MKLELLINDSATGDAMHWPGGEGTFSVVGTFGGATVTLQFLGPDGSTWIDAGTEATLTEAGGCSFILASGDIRAEVTGGTPSGLYATASEAKFDR